MPPARVWPQVIQQAQPSWRSLRLVSKDASLRLASGPLPQPACWRVLRLRLASGPAQLATQPQAQVCMKQALPIQQPGPSSRRNQQHSPAARQPATHPWFRSLVAETSFRPSPTRSGFSNVSETGLRPTTSLTCLRLVSSYASYYACLTCPSPPVRLPKQLSPG